MSKEHKSKIDEKASVHGSTAAPSGRLFIVSGPSGAGKGTVVAEVLKLMPCLKKSVSVTTRPPRTGENSGRSYIFATKEEFAAMVSRGDFLEYDRHFEHFYGTPKKFVADMLARGQDVMLEIDINGALNAKRMYPAAVLIFIDAPSMDELVRRLRSRSSESEEQLAERLARVKSEQALRAQYDYEIINDDVSAAVQKLISIIQEAQNK